MHHSPTITDRAPLRHRLGGHGEACCVCPHIAVVSSVDAAASRRGPIASVSPSLWPQRTFSIEGEPGDDDVGGAMTA